jgi:hypothetical protein
MKPLRLLALACGAALLAAPALRAQEKADGPKIQKKEVKKGAYDDMRQRFNQGAGDYRLVAGNETLTHGDFVTVTRKNGDKLTGVFVWADPKSGKMYVRPKAGQAPVGIATGDVNNIERITPAANGKGKGGIRPAIEPEGGTGPAYEIHSMQVHNGPYTTVYFFDTSLSAAERDQLSALEKAGNDVAQKGMEVEMLNKAIENNINQPPVSVVTTGGYGDYGPYGPLPYPYYYPVAYGLYSPLLPGLNFGGNYLYYYGGIPSWYYPGYFGGGGSNTTVVMQNGGDSGKSLAALRKSLNEAQTALAAAEKQYTTAARRGVYDPSGRIVAVRLEE